MTWFSLVAEKIEHFPCMGSNIANRTASSSGLRETVGCLGHMGLA
jgi:hypothetical protein